MARQWCWRRPPSCVPFLAVPAYFIISPGQVLYVWYLVTALGALTLNPNKALHFHWRQVPVAQCAVGDDRMQWNQESHLSQAACSPLEILLSNVHNKSEHSWYGKIFLALNNRFFVFTKNLFGRWKMAERVSESKTDRWLVFFNKNSETTVVCSVA